METIEQRYANRSAAAPGVDPIAERYGRHKIATKRQPEIYRKGGIYDQFGPNPPVFNAMPRAFGGMVQTGADQPGAALPFVGQTAGGYAGPVGGVVGALAGEGIRQGVGRLFGVQDEADIGRQFGAAGRAAVEGEIFGLGATGAMRGAASALETAKPGAKDLAVRTARNIIRPTGRLAKKGERIAETSLKEGVLSSNLKKMSGKVGAAKEQVSNEIDSLISQYEDRTITADGALRRMDALARRYKQLGDTPSAEKVLAVKNDLIQSQNLKEPVFGEVETGQFVMGPASKQVKPKITQSVSDEIPASMRGKKRFESVRTESGKFGRSEPKSEVFTPKKSVEKPEDVVAMNVPKRLSDKSPQRIYTAGPEETYSIRPETKGPSKKETKQIGQKPRQITIKEAQNIKRGQYRLLEGKRVGGGYSSETTAPEIAARQQYAGGVKREIANKIPEIDPVNRRFGDLIELEKAVTSREAVAGRNDLLGLKDVILATNPKAWPLLLARRTAQAMQSPAARQLYRFGTSPAAEISEMTVNPVVRALIGSLRRPVYN